CYQECLRGNLSLSSVVYINLKSALHANIKYKLFHIYVRNFGFNIHLKSNLPCRSLECTNVMKMSRTRRCLSSYVQISLACGYKNPPLACTNSGRRIFIPE